MWQEAKANDKRIKELMVDHKKRAERRRAYYESRLGDPRQLIRVIGSASKVYPDAEQFYYHENTDNLLPWQGNTDIKIDRFDGRSLLDFVPEPAFSKQGYSEQDMSDELNFERYHDLIEAERLNVTEAERLAKVEEEWTKLLDRHQAKLAMLKTPEKEPNRGFAFDYGTAKVSEDTYDVDDDKETQLYKEADILQYVDDLTDKDKKVLNEMSSKYGIKSYARLLRIAKKDRDDELRALKRRQEENKPKEGTRTSRRNERRKRRRRRERELERELKSGRYRRRDSPTYQPYEDNDDDDDVSTSTDDDDDDDRDGDEQGDFVIEFGSSAPEESTKNEHEESSTEQNKSNTPVTTQEKKLTPMEKLKLKMRAGLEKQIISDERDKRQKNKEKEIEYLQDLAKNQGLPINAYLRPEPPTRYRSPSISSNDESSLEKTTTSTSQRYRSPSKSRSPPRRRYRSPSKSHSPPRRRYRSPSKSRSPPRRRYRSPSKSRSPPRKRYRSPSKSRSPPRRRYRSPSTDKSRSPKRRYKSPIRKGHEHISKDKYKSRQSTDKRKDYKRY